MPSNWLFFFFLIINIYNNKKNFYPRLNQYFIILNVSLWYNSLNMAIFKVKTTGYMQFDLVHDVKSSELIKNISEYKSGLLFPFFTTFPSFFTIARYLDLPLRSGVWVGNFCPNNIHLLTSLRFPSICWIQKEINNHMQTSPLPN